MRFLPFALLLFVPFLAPASPPDPIQSIRPITISHVAICTAFSLAPKVWVTAAHCVKTGGRTLDGQPYTILRQDDKVDLAYLSSDTVIAGGLILAKEEPRPGDRWTSVGYGGPFGPPLWAGGIVSNVNIKLEPTEQAPWPSAMILYGGVAWGHSGGPILNANNEVIGVMVAGGKPETDINMYSLAVPLKALKKFLGRN